MNTIREAREALGLTIYELAEKIGVHFTTVSEWELGKSYPRPKKRIALSKALNKTQDELFPKAGILKSTHEGKIKIGEKEIDCAVLGDGTRVITENAVFDAFNRPRRGKSAARSGGITLPSFIDAKNLRPFINQEVEDGIKEIYFVNLAGKERMAYSADIIPLVCDVYLEARNAGVLLESQEKVALASEIIVRSLSKVGIIALVDEATGYQEIRDRKALQIILDKYIAQELQPYVKTFPLDFYYEMARLRKWDIKTNGRWPHAAANYTNDLIYARLAPGVLEELKKVNSKDSKGKRKGKLFQGLTKDIGHPKLIEHIAGAVALMKANDNWDMFMLMMGKVYPKYEDRQYEFDF